MMQANEIKPGSDSDEINIIEPYHMALFDNKIKDIYQSLSAEGNPQKRLEQIANAFIGQPYTWEPLGEGVDGKYYQEPLYRTDRFDCVTLTDTILALANATNLAQFQSQILQIRYSDSNVKYQTRTDWFTDLEWLPNAEKLGWVEDVTDKIVDENQKPIALLASTVIDKPNWYKARPMKFIHLLEPIKKENAINLLNQLHAEGLKYQAKPSDLSYLPLNILFDSEGQANPYYFNQIPSAAVIVIVRPDWQIKDHLEGFPHGYGTNLNVSHLGIAIRTEEGLQFFHASSVDKKVVRTSLIEYLQHYLHSESIKGIHVEKIVFN